MPKNSLFYERLSLVIKQSGKSANKIERELGYARNALHNYKIGSEPCATRLIELSQYFQVSPAYLIGKEHQRVLGDFRGYFEQLSEEQKLEMMKIVQEWGNNKVNQVKNVLIKNVSDGSNVE